jgi:hypothetical protein
VLASMIRKNITTLKGKHNLKSTNKNIVLKEQIINTHNAMNEIQYFL